MMRLAVRSLAGLVLSLTLVRAAAGAPPAPPQPAAQPYQPPAEDSASAAITRDARELAAALGMPQDRQDLVLRRLDAALHSGQLPPRPGQAINGVFAYQIGEGGFLVKVKRGKGLVRFPGVGDRPFLIKGASVGANIGGSSEWGVGLVVGLTRLDFFGGDYRGRETGATAAEASNNVAVLVRSPVPAADMVHEIYLIGAASGLSANAGRAKLTLLLGN